MINVLIALAITTTIFIACSPENSEKYTPPEQVSKKATSGEAKIITHEPNRDVEILFVIDPSSSMASIIKEVHANIDQFASKFISDKDSKVHFRIGVTTAWDTEHFEKVLPAQALALKDKTKSFWPNLNFDLVKGKLKPVVKGGIIDLTLPAYVTHDMTNTDELFQTLRDTLKVNAEIYKYELVPNTENKIRNVFQLQQFTSDKSFKGSPDFVLADNNKALYGPSPENEEFFTVIKHMLSDEMREINSGFPNPNANQLAVFIITDAEDDVKNRHNISAEDIYSDLVKYMGNDKSKVVVYGALYKSELDNCQVKALDQNGNFIIEPKYINGHKATDGILNPNYVNGEDTYKLVDKSRDPGLKGARNVPAKIEKLIKISGGQVKSICSSDFGEELASVGLSIKEKTLEQRDVIIDIKAAYDKNKIEVFYADQPVPFKFSTDHDTEVVVLKEDYTYQEGKSFRVEFDQLTRKNQNK